MKNLSGRGDARQKSNSILLPPPEGDKQPTTLQNRNLSCAIGRVRHNAMLKTGHTKIREKLPRDLFEVSDHGLHVVELLVLLEPAQTLVNKLYHAFHIIAVHRLNGGMHVPERKRYQSRRNAATRISKCIGIGSGRT